jgi:nicotinate-nucleotide adenylyltransferase
MNRIKNGNLALFFRSGRQFFTQARHSAYPFAHLASMRTALYGGSFDPIHYGHLLLAREAMEQVGLDRVIFIPAAVSPFKLNTQPAPPEIRLAMVQAAIAGESGFECDGSEIQRAGPSFTIDTVLAWQEKAPGDAFFYFIGQDNVPDLDKWRDAARLKQLVQFVVFERDAAAPPHPYVSIRRRFDISSTEVRKRVAEGRSIRYLVPETVRSIIETHQLYQGGHH